MDKATTQNSAEPDRTTRSNSVKLDAQALYNFKLSPKQKKEPTTDNNSDARPRSSSYIEETTKLTKSPHSF